MGGDDLERTSSVRRQSSFTKSVSSLFKKKKKSKDDGAPSTPRESEATPAAPAPAPEAAPAPSAPAEPVAAVPAPAAPAEPSYATNYDAAASEPPAEPVAASDIVLNEAPTAAAGEAPAAPAAEAQAPEEAPAAAAPAAEAPAPAPAPASEAPAPLEPPALTATQAGSEPTAAEQDAETPLEAGWEAVTADDGRVYYWKEETDETTWEKPSSRQASQRNSAAEQRASSTSVAAAAAAYETAPAATEVADEPGPRRPSVSDRAGMFEDGSAYVTPAPTEGETRSRRQSGTDAVVKQLQKAGISDDPNKAAPTTAAPTQHKLAIAALERKAERRAQSVTSAGSGMSQMSDALKGLQAAQARPEGPSQHSVAMEKLRRQSEMPASSRSGAVEEAKQSGAGGVGAAKAALFQKKQEAEPKMSMKEEAMRRLNGKGVVSTKEAFQTKSSSNSQHNAALKAFQNLDGVDVSQGGPKKSELRKASAAPGKGGPARNTGIGADGGQTQRAAAMAAFQGVIKE